MLLPSKSAPAKCIGESLSKVGGALSLTAWSISQLRFTSDKVGSNDQMTGQTDVSFTPNSGRQYERPTQRHYRHRTGRSRQPSRSSLHPRQPCPLLHSSRHVEECADVQSQRGEGTWGGYGKRKGDGQPGKRAKRT